MCVCVYVHACACFSMCVCIIMHVNAFVPSRANQHCIYAITTALEDYLSPDMSNKIKGLVILYIGGGGKYMKHDGF